MDLDACISNYYFSKKKPVFASDKFHVTSFEEGFPKYIYRYSEMDTFLRMNLRKCLKGIRENNV
jgi:hypothetical protein